MLRDMVGRVLGLRREELHHTWDFLLGIIAGFAAVIASALLTEWPLNKKQTISLIGLTLLTLIIILLVRSKRMIIASILFFLAFKWIIAAFYVPSTRAGIIAAALAVVGYIVAGGPPFRVVKRTTGPPVPRC